MKKMEKLGNVSLNSKIEKEYISFYDFHAFKLNWKRRAAKMNNFHFNTFEFFA